MLFLVLDQLQYNATYALITLAAFVVGIAVALSFHEASHALSAYLLGDSTAKREGRLTLNPASHIDPFGGIMLLLVGFGWAKPTPVDPRYLRGNPRSGMALVSLAGPISNVAVAIAAALPIRFGLVDSDMIGFRRFFGGDLVDYVVVSFVFWNLLIAAFNLLPVAPLDGFKVVLGILPRDLAVHFARLERVGPLILMLLIASGFFLPFNLLIVWMRPVVNALAFLVTGSTVW